MLIIKNLYLQKEEKMENNMTLLLLTEKQIHELNIRAFYHITQYNNKPVPIEFYCEAMILISRIESEKLEKIRFTSEEKELLEDSSRSHYLLLDNKEVGESLYEKVRVFIDHLKQEQMNNVEY